MTVTAHGIELNNDHIQDVRELRLWHWSRVLAERLNEKTAIGITISMIFKERANFHLRQVQTLNMFFPVGDTAEKDYEKYPNIFRYIP